MTAIVTPRCTGCARRAAAKASSTQGIFTGNPSTFPYTFSGDETFHVIEGDVTIEVEHAAVDLHPGDIVSFPKGATSVWRVHKPFKKFFVISG